MTSNDRNHLLKTLFRSNLAFSPGEELPMEHSPESCARPRNPAFELGAVRSVQPAPEIQHKVIALTFDMCERPNEITGYDGRIVDILRRLEVKATFFICGKWMKTHRDRAKQLILDSLFEVGNHSWDHANLVLADQKEISFQIDATAAFFEELKAELAIDIAQKNVSVPWAIAEKQLRHFRFPYGRYDERCLKAVRSRGMRSIQWSVVTGDPDPEQSSAHITDAVLNAAQSGSIVIFHANGRGWNTAAALEHIIMELKKRNYNFLTVSELLAVGEAVISKEAFEEVPGDNERYDSL